MRRHWSEKDFRITSESPAYDGSNVTNRFGYCAVCQRDMQSFGTNGKPGPILHYKSRTNYRHANRVPFDPIHWGVRG